MRKKATASISARNVTASPARETAGLIDKVPFGPIKTFSKWFHGPMVAEVQSRVGERQVEIFGAASVLALETQRMG
jgi:hypothetical protein